MSDRLFFHPILMYHQICPVDHPAYDPYLSVSDQTFEKQITALKNSGWNFVTFAQLIKQISLGNVPRRQLCLTFDDACGNFYQYAFPLLKKLSVCGTVFVIGNSLLGKPYHNLPSCGIEPLSAAELQQMLACGIEVGSHTMSHRELTSLSQPEELAFELEESKALLEKILKTSVTSFCYPRGAYNEMVIEAVKKAGFSAACSIQRGSFHHDPKERFCLKRVRIGEKHIDLRLHYSLSRFWGYSKMLTSK